MIVKDPTLLNQVQDIVFANKSYWPLADGETFCNEATQDVLNRLGYTAMDGLSADEMYAFVTTSKDWLIKPMADAQGLANEGVILISILPSTKLSNTAHGHVNTLTTGTPGFSGHWNLTDPMCMNLGRAGTCFRQQGISYAFIPIPEIYALVETL